jgi:hypothetical protein
MDSYDLARMIGCAVNAPKELDTRGKELDAKIHADASAPPKPKFTHEEMQAAAQRLVTAVITTGKLPKRGVQ